MAKHYFVDSENVGDSWVALVEACGEDDQIIVFYTQKSPHMSYKSLVQLKSSPRNIEFIECGVGNNALDFQLCTELGYRVHDIGDNEFLIVTNDTGYEAAANYWKRRGVAVRRIPGNLCMKAQPAAQPVLPQQQQLSAGKTKPVKADAGKPDSVNPESGKTGAAKTDSVKAEAALTEAVKSSIGIRTANSEPVTGESTKTEIAKAESAKTESSVAEHGRKDFGRRGRSRTRADRYGRHKAGDATQAAEAESNGVGNAQAENGNAAVPAEENGTAAAALVAEPVQAAVAPAVEPVPEHAAPDMQTVADTVPDVQTVPAAEDAVAPAVQVIEAPAVQTLPVIADAAENAESENNAALPEASVEAAAAAPAAEAVTAPAAENAMPEATAPETGTKGNRPGSEDAAREILYILGRENLQMLHESLQQIFGPQKGKDYYNSFKTGSANNAFLNAHKKLSPAEKKNLYCSIVFDQAETPVPLPADFAAFVSDTWKRKKNLNSFRSALQSRYGRAMCNSYYSLIKSHMKILDTIG